MELDGEAKLKKIPKQKYTPEFRELLVKRVKGGQSIGAVVREPAMHSIEMQALRFLEALRGRSSSDANNAASAFRTHITAGSADAKDHKGADKHASLSSASLRNSMKCSGLRGLLK